MYQLNNLSEKTYPTQDELFEFFKRADQTRWKDRDTRPLMAILNRVLDTSPRIEGHLLTRRTAYSSFRYKLSGSDDVYIEKAFERLKDLFEAVLEGYIYSKAYGVFALKIRWEGDGTPAVEDQYQPIQLDYDKNSLIIIDEDTGDKSLIDSNTQEYLWHISNPYGSRGGFLRKILEAEMLRRDNVIDWADTNKRLKGLIMATIDSAKFSVAADNPDLGGMDEALNSLKKVDYAARNVGTNAYLRAMDYVGLDAKSLADSQAGNSFDSFKTAMDADIAIAILGTANLPENSQVGSFAAAKVQNLLRVDILCDDMKRIKKLCDQICLLDHRKNYDPNAKRAPFSFEWIYDENEDTETNARVFETLSRLDNVKVEENEFYLKLNLKKPDGEHGVIVLKPANNGGPL